MVSRWRTPIVAIAACLVLAATAVWADQSRPPPSGDPPLVRAFAALLGGRKDDALQLLKDVQAGADGAAADMIRASLLAADGSAARKAEARAILAARASMPDHSAVMAPPWTCDHRKGSRSALFDLAALDDTPDETLIERAMRDGDGRAALWIAASLASRHAERKDAKLALDQAWKANIVEAYYPEAVFQTAVAGTGRPVDVAASFYLFAITFAADQRAFDDVMARPTKIPQRLYREIKAHIETERHEDLTDEQFRAIVTEVFARNKAELANRPDWERHFCAVREHGW